MGFHGRAAAHKPKITMCSVKRRPGVVGSSPPLDSAAVNAFLGVMNHAAPSGSPADESGFGGCQENATC